MRVRVCSRFCTPSDIFTSLPTYGPSRLVLALNLKDLLLLFEVALECRELNEKAKSLFLHVVVETLAIVPLHQVPHNKQSGA